MRILLINVAYETSSTGKICAEIAQHYLKEGHEVKVAYGRKSVISEEGMRHAIRIGSDFGVRIHGIFTRIFDKHGLGSVHETKKFLKWAEEYNPDFLWLHNIHGYYINYELLFEWIKKRPQMKVKWTLHDCWAFTGHCGYFTMANCNKWKTHCYQCAQKKGYPRSLIFDNSRMNFERKKKAFTGVNNLKIVVPSQWLANLVKESFLAEYPLTVRYNSINTDVFKPTSGDFRTLNHLEGKKIVLGVANVWEERKGLKDFLELAEMLDDSYQIVLVGLDDLQIKSLPKNILGIKRTTSAQELASIYTTADVYVNPSKEETFGMTVIEAKACGTEVVVYSNTACEEVARIYGGKVVSYGSLRELYEAIVEICSKTQKK